jgi:putative transcriptional regulator
VNVLRLKRETLGYNYTQMAEAIGITRQHYAYIEEGKRQPSIKIALAIAHTLNATVEELFGNESLPDISEACDETATSAETPQDDPTPTNGERGDSPAPRPGAENAAGGQQGGAGDDLAAGETGPEGC